MELIFRIRCSLRAHTQRMRQNPNLPHAFKRARSGVGDLNPNPADPLNASLQAVLFRITPERDILQIVTMRILIRPLFLLYWSF